MKCGLMDKPARTDNGHKKNRVKGKPGKSQGRKAIGSKALRSVMIAWLQQMRKSLPFLTEGQAFIAFDRLIAYTMCQLLIVL